MRKIVVAGLVAVLTTLTVGSALATEPPVNGCNADGQNDKFHTSEFPTHIGNDGTGCSVGDPGR